MTKQAISMENLLKGNPASKIQEALGYTKESVIKELAEKYEIEWTNKSSVIIALSLAMN